jgi:hypothetical protein
MKEIFTAQFDRNFPSIYILKKLNKCFFYGYKHYRMIPLVYVLIRWFAYSGTSSRRSHKRATCIVCSEINSRTHCSRTAHTHCNKIWANDTPHLTRDHNCTNAFHLSERTNHISGYKTVCLYLHRQGTSTPNYHPILNKLTHDKPTCRPQQNPKFQNPFRSHFTSPHLTLWSWS